MTVLKQYNTATSTWDTIVVGQPGEAGIVNGTVAPADTSVLWLDTADTSSQVAVPAGGTAGQVLAKTNGTDYATQWIDRTGYGNVVINGGFDVWQRGTSFSNPSSSSASFTADRWQYVRNANQSGIQVTRESAELPGFQYCARIRRISGDTATNLFRFGTSIETVNSIQFAGKPITISFYVRKGSDWTGQVGIDVYSGIGIDQGMVWNEPTGIYNVVAQTVSALSTSWQRVSYTGTVPSNSTQLGVRFWGTDIFGTAGTNAYFDITGVQLEIGSAATPFQRSGGDIAGELAKCQRYYQRFAPGAYREYMQGYAQTTNSVGFIPRLYCKMRVFPTSVEYNDIYFYDGSSYPSMTSLTLFGGEFGTISANFSSVTQFRNYTMYAGTSGNSYLALSAEIV